MPVTRHPYNSYSFGTAVQLTGTFSVSSTNTDPTAVTLEITDPSGNVDTYSTTDLTNSAVGVYNKTITPDEAGLWRYRFAGTGAVIAANIFKFYVEST
jgi:uncharacterized protein YfaS (alpha-2-macroglobulin family)